MIYKIKEGKHRAWPPNLKFWVNKSVISKEVVFSKGCAYSIAGEDMNDTNKLFGIGYLTHHHQDSARFGWRFDSELGKIVISAYTYVNGVRKITELASVELYEKVRCTIRIEKNHYIFHVYGKDILQRHIVPFTHNKKIGYGLGFYFGGNKVAPNDMEVIIND